MNVLIFEGGLGNQMFQYAFYLGVKKKYGGVWLFDDTKSKNHHNGFELDKIFGLCRPKWFYHYAIRSLRKLGLRKSVIKEQTDIYYNKIQPIKKTLGYVAYEGFWQSEKYFLDVEKEVKKAFLFDPSKYNYASKILSEKIAAREHNYISLHVRRGDYMYELQRHVCDIGYYNRAIDYMREHIINPYFIIFSDDIQWCRSQFKDSNEILYVDWNQNTDSWQDMSLMSKCSHHIIANSSFSWWGAWLGENNDKIVICPKHWNVDYPLDTDRIPQKWVRL